MKQYSWSFGEAIFFGITLIIFAFLGGFFFGIPGSIGAIIIYTWFAQSDFNQKKEDFYRKQSFLNR